MQQSRCRSGKRSTDLTHAGSPVPAPAVAVFAALLLISLCAPASHAEWRLGASAGAGVSVLNGADWKDDLAFDDAEEQAAFGGRAALHVGYRFLPWLAARVSFSTLRAGSRFEYIEDAFDDEIYEYEGSLRWWSGGPGAHAEIRIPVEPVEPYVSVGAIASFPFSRFVRDDVSNEISIVRRVPAERAVALHLAGEVGVRIPVGAITALAGVHYERSLTGYFEASAWPRLYANVFTVNAGVEIPLGGSR